MNIQAVFWVFIGGGTGSVLRYLIGLFQKSVISSHLPIGTFLANMLACLLMAGWIKIQPSGFTQEPYKLLLLTGFCGGLSTFSTFSMESVALFRAGQTQWAIVNILINLIVCLGLLMWGLRK
jgi:CrcB protein